MDTTISVYESIPFLDVLFPIKINLDAHLTPDAVNCATMTWHEQLELLYFTRGGAVVRCGNRSIRVSDGDVILINPCELHRLYYGDGEPLYDCIMLDPMIYSGANQDVCKMRYITPMQEQRIFLENIVKDPRAIGFVQDLLSEYRTQGAAYELAIKGDILHFLAILFRNAVSEVRSEGDARRIIQRYERLEPAMQYIGSHYQEDLRLETLARLCNMDPSHFCRSFKATTGKTVMEYLNEYRLQKAKILLQTTKQSITEVACAVGFSDNSYFSKRFKKFFGCLPKDTRASTNENTAP